MSHMHQRDRIKAVVRSVVDTVGPLRIPLIGATIFAWLPLAAIQEGDAARLLRGLFDMNPSSRDADPLCIGMLTAITCFCAWFACGLVAVALYQSTFLVVMFGPRRFGHEIAGTGGRCTTTVLRAVGFLLCMPALIASTVVSLDRSPYPSAAFFGGLFAFALVVVVLGGAVWLCAGAGPEALASFQAKLRPVASWIDARGYVNDATEVAAKKLDPFPHHVWATLFVLFCLSASVALSIWARHPSLHDSIRVPALASAMLLLMLLIWVFSAATFFFDAHRVPIVTLALVFASLGHCRVHTYDTFPSTTANVRAAWLPTKLLEKRTKTLPGFDPKRLVVIASAGGGIQAAAWTARVLQGIAESASPEELDIFMRQTVVVSGVSGGSVGLAPFVLVSTAASGEAKREAFLRGLASAADSSLDPVAALMATTDLLPGWFRDRGWALETSWRRAWDGAGLPTTDTLTALAERAGSTATPAFMFNATSMTTGERLVIGTTVPKVAPDTDPHGFVHAARIALSTETDDHVISVDYTPRDVGDLRLATAARLSAAFPFVTPAARAEPPGAEPDHIVDGGYIDNYGTESLVEWLEPVLDDPQTRVTFIQIVAFPEGTQKRRDESDGHAPAEPSQLLVPVQTMMNVRDPGQGRRAVRDLDRLRARVATKDAASANASADPSGAAALVARDSRLCVYRFVFDACHQDLTTAPPLSWHLTAGQREAVAEGWNRCVKAAGPVQANDLSYRHQARNVLAHMMGKANGECLRIEPPLGTAAGERSARF